jgi:hypothetical protein
MAKEKDRNEIASLVRLAGITVPDERLDALAAGLAGMQAQAHALARHDYGVTEPASRFRSPASASGP